MRVLALDFGEAHCGVAVSDPSGTLATPLEPLSRPGTRKGVQRIKTLAESLEAELILVGLPISLSGQDTAQTQETRAFAKRLQNVVSVPVELHDERFTTKLAQAIEGQADEHSRAAAVLLESWLATR